VNLAVYMMVSTIGIFMIGAAFALAWSLASGQWKHLDEAARIVLDDDENWE